MKGIVIILIILINLQVYSQCTKVRDIEDSGLCNVDIMCSENYGINSFIENYLARSVAKLIINPTLIFNPELQIYEFEGGTRCSGTLIVQRGVNANDLKTFLINFNVI